MPKLARKDLASLYPEPKTFDEIEAERKHREELQRPKLVPLKISFWTTLGIITVLVAYQIGKQVMMSSLSSAGEVIFATFFSFLIVLIVGAILLYLYIRIIDLGAKVFVITSRLYMVLAGMVIFASVILTALVQQGVSILLATAIVSSAVFVSMYFLVDFIAKHDSK